MYQQALPLLHSQVHRAGENTEKKNNSRVKRLGKIKHTDTFMSPNRKNWGQGKLKFSYQRIVFWDTQSPKFPYQTTLRCPIQYVPISSTKGLNVNVGQSTLQTRPSKMEICPK